MVMDENIIELKGLRKDYKVHVALNNINLYVRKNEFITLLGPSGCGKTTTLRLIAGFELPTEGQILFKGKDISSFPPHKRNVNTVFQKYALFPHLDIYENIAFGLRLKNMDSDIIDKKVKDMLHLVNLDGFEKREVDSLSGGQQQRIAIARALVNEPEVLLLDEPLAALDLKIRKEMQTELKKMQQSLGITFIFVTHDQEEALTMSDTVVVMKDGSIQQIGTPEMIYNEPKTAFIAEFIGESNIVNGIMHEDLVVEFLGRTFECLDKGFGKMEDVDVVIRPEDIKIVSYDDGMLKGTVESVIFKGVHYEMMVNVQGNEFMLHNTDMAPIGGKIGLKIDPDDIHIMKKAVKKDDK